VWVELTSKCPFDCIFCSRKSRRGVGDHLPFSIFESLVRQVQNPRKFLLNYSGESTVYPHLIAAIQLARSTGATVELVSALASAPEQLLKQISTSGLSRLTVSMHAADSSTFSEIYRYSSFEVQLSRLEHMVSLCRSVEKGPVVDIAFVAMQRNLRQMESVAGIANRLGITKLFIFPIIRRDEIPINFPNELASAGRYTDHFRTSLAQHVERAKVQFPQIAFTVCDSSMTHQPDSLGEVPISCPGPLPIGARIHSCEQNPWETAHVLSNGDVVGCEVRDRKPFGNLSSQSLSDIWNGEAYARFRSAYMNGDVTECRACPWKTAYFPTPLRGEILPGRGFSAQFGYGWHPPSDETCIWSSQRALAVLQPMKAASVLQVAGVLPPGTGGNDVTVSCNGRTIGKVINSSETSRPFDLFLDVPQEVVSQVWQLEFHTRHVYRPLDQGTGEDQRDLGFALSLLAAKSVISAAQSRRQTRDFERLVSAIDRFDRMTRMFNRFRGRSRPDGSHIICSSGLSVIIPERENIPELLVCLAALRDASILWREPMEVIIVVNGCTAESYRDVKLRYSDARWLFFPAPLGFAEAVDAGLAQARYDWVYLLNSDVRVAPDALLAAGMHRGENVFSIGSQIMLKDTTRFREETNLTRLFLENGLATIHDLIPNSPNTIEHFYSGGGASMFQRRLLRQVLDVGAYNPFYWEDVEWGWRARKWGFKALFCPDSVVWHSQRATISRFYTPEEIDEIWRRNQLCFHLRNMTTIGPMEHVLAAIENAPPNVAAHLNRWSTMIKIMQGRQWNHRAPLTDEQLLSTDRHCS
jgi:GT2 family glycosyltransferase/MoaA/NifB/PqqE/SkfB family radical SAM enzyme